MSKPLRILLADDHEVVRRGLKQMIGEQFASIEFGEAANSAEILDQVHRADWDLLLLDITLPGRSGLDVLSDIRARRSALRVLVLTMSPEEEYAVRAFRKGASGYLTKQAVATDLIEAVKRVLAGGRYITPSLAERLAQEVGNPNSLEGFELLSDRELQVLTMIACGRSVRQIADELSLSEKTVFTYRDRLRVKLGIRSDVELTRYAIRNHLVEWGDT